MPPALEAQSLNHLTSREVPPTQFWLEGSEFSLSRSPPLSQLHMRPMGLFWWSQLKASTSHSRSQHPPDSSHFGGQKSLQIWGPSETHAICSAGRRRVSLAFHSTLQRFVCSLRLRNPAPGLLKPAKETLGLQLRFQKAQQKPFLHP